MKQYVIDQLREIDYRKVHDFLTKTADVTEFGDLFWVKLPAELYSVAQKEHEHCAPFWFAVNLSLSALDFEFLIRSRKTLRCSCINYAVREQRDYIMDYADRMIGNLGIRI
jgi:hypothetical protein